MSLRATQTICLMSNPQYRIVMAPTFASTCPEAASCTLSEITSSKDYAHSYEATLAGLGHQEKAFDKQLMTLGIALDPQTIALPPEVPLSIDAAAQLHRLLSTAKEGVRKRDSNMLKECHDGLVKVAENLQAWDHFAHSLAVLDAWSGYFQGIRVSSWPKFE